MNTDTSASRPTAAEPGPGEGDLRRVISRPMLTFFILAMITAFV